MKRPEYAIANRIHTATADKKFDVQLRRGNSNGVSVHKSMSKRRIEVSCFQWKQKGIQRKKNVWKVFYHVISHLLAENCYKLTIDSKKRFLYQKPVLITNVFCAENFEKLSQAFTFYSILRSPKKWMRFQYCHGCLSVSHTLSPGPQFQQNPFKRRL